MKTLRTRSWWFCDPIIKRLSHPEIGCACTKFSQNLSQKFDLNRTPHYFRIMTGEKIHNSVNVWTIHDCNISAWSARMAHHSYASKRHFWSSWKFSIFPLIVLCLYYSETECLFLEGECNNALLLALSLLLSLVTFVLFPSCQPIVLYLSFSFHSFPSNGDYSRNSPQ